MVPYLTPERRAQLEFLRPTVRYLSGTEVHVYALAISASVLLSFFPFLNVMLSMCRNVLHSRAAEDAIYLALNDYFPGELASFLKRNLTLQGQLQFTSMILLLFTANGIFEPLEVALNRAWGEVKNRSYLKNQLVALGMIFLCGALALVSLMLTALNRQWIATWESLGAVQGWLNLLMFKLAAVPISILALFLVYWLLPNRKIPPARVAPAAICRGADPRIPQIREPRRRTLPAGQTRARVFHLPPLGGHPAVELRRVPGGAGRSGVDRALAEPEDPVS